jgi:[citrate (pro-3S)-lyase] ligase
MITYEDAILSFDRDNIQNFLAKFDMRYEADIDYTIIAKDKEKIIGTGSLSENVLKCFAVDPEYRGQGLLNTIVTKLLEKAYSMNQDHIFVFTKPCNKDIFKNLGFDLVAEVDEVILLDNKIENLYKILKGLKNDIESGAVVINANPMTKGHLKLIEKASTMVEKLFVFVLSEDKSEFPFEFRYKVVKEACENLENVEVIPGNDYIISRNTFPTYFYKDSRTIIDAYTKLDATIFGKYFAKAMNIKKRFLGKEINDLVTKDYNDKMKKILPSYGVEVIEIDRFKESGRVISASEVRKLLREKKLDQAMSLLTQASINALNTDEGRKIIDRL